MKSPLQPWTEEGPESFNFNVGGGRRWKHAVSPVKDISKQLNILISLDTTLYNPEKSSQLYRLQMSENKDVKSPLRRRAINYPEVGRVRPSFAFSDAKPPKENQQGTGLPDHKYIRRSAFQSVPSSEKANNHLAIGSSSVHPPPLGGNPR